MTTLANDDAAILALQALGLVSIAFALLVMAGFYITRRPKNRRRTP